MDDIYPDPFSVFEVAAYYENVTFTFRKHDDFNEYEVIFGNGDNRYGIIVGFGTIEYWTYGMSTMELLKKVVKPIIEDAKKEIFK